MGRWKFNISAHWTPSALHWDCGWIIGGFAWLPGPWRTPLSWSFCLVVKPRPTQVTFEMSLVFFFFFLSMVFSFLVVLCPSQSAPWDTVWTAVQALEATACRGWTWGSEPGRGGAVSFSLFIPLPFSSDGILLRALSLRCFSFKGHPAQSAVSSVGFQASGSTKQRLAGHFCFLPFYLWTLKGRKSEWEVGEMGGEVLGKQKKVGISKIFSSPIILCHYTSASHQIPWVQVQWLLKFLYSFIHSFYWLCFC